jgi:hypothetical protein
MTDPISWFFSNWESKDEDEQTIVEQYKSKQDERDYKGIEIDEDGNVLNPQCTTDGIEHGLGVYLDSETNTFYDRYGRECDENGNRY